MKEIEKKWLWNYELISDNVSDFFNDSYLPKMTIKDYYFNKYCRLRNYGGLDYITVKSEGTLVRDEFEAPLYENYFKPNVWLEKERVFFNYYDNTFEVNLFKDIMVKPNIPLVIVELELKENQCIPLDIPSFCGKDITEDKSFYGYNLFNFLVSNSKDTYFNKL